MAVRIRRMETSDLPAVAAIERAITKSRRTSTLQAYVRRQLGAGEGVCLVAAVGGTVAGFLVGGGRPGGFGADPRARWGGAARKPAREDARRVGRGPPRRVLPVPRIRPRRGDRPGAVRLI